MKRVLTCEAWERRIRDDLARVERLVIDREYPGRPEVTIKAALLMLARSAGFELTAEMILFREIGKRSRAHERAYRTYRGEILPDKVAAANELAVLLLGK